MKIHYAGVKLQGGSGGAAFALAWIQAATGGVLDMGGLVAMGIVLLGGEVSQM